MSAQSDSKIAWIGQSKEREALRSACDFVLRLSVDQAIYLGPREDLEGLVSEWEKSVDGDTPFLDRALHVARDGTPEAIAQVLESDRIVRGFARLRVLPPEPKRAVELVGGRIVLAVRDKSILDEDDVASAMLVVFDSSGWLFRPIGPRTFFSPGPLTDNVVGILDDSGDGELRLLKYEVGNLEPIDSMLVLSGANQVTVSG